MLGDLKWDCAGPGCVLSLGDVTDARAFHLKKKIIDPRHSFWLALSTLTFGFYNFCRGSEVSQGPSALHHGPLPDRDQEASENDASRL